MTDPHLTMWSNYRAALDAVSPFCYLLGATGPARVSAER